MKPVFQFTGNREADWDAICLIWKERESVMSGAVGATWVMPPQHKVCLEFAEHYPDAKEFLIGHLSDSDPRIAAYAFKTLIRTAELSRSDLPPHVAARKDKIAVLVHSLTNRQTLRDFFAHYFDSQDRESTAAGDELAVRWQDNELAKYLKATQNPDKVNEDPPDEDRA